MVQSQSRESLEAHNSVSCVQLSCSTPLVPDKSRLERWKAGKARRSNHKLPVRLRTDLSMGILSTLTRSPQPTHRLRSLPKPELNDSESSSPGPVKHSLECVSSDKYENEPTGGDRESTSFYATEPRTFQIKLPQTSASSIAPDKSQLPHISLNQNPHNCLANENRGHSSLAVESGSTPSSVAHGEIPNEDPGANKDHSSTLRRRELPGAKATLSEHSTHPSNSATIVPQANGRPDGSQLKNATTNGFSSASPKHSREEKDVHAREKHVLNPNDGNDLFCGKRRRSSYPSGQTAGCPEITNSLLMNSNATSDTLPPLKIRKAASQRESTPEKEESIRTNSLPHNTSKPAKSEPCAILEPHRTIVKKRDFIRTGMRLRPRPRLSKCGTRHGPLRSSRSHPSWFGPMPNQVGGGSLFSRMQSQTQVQDKNMVENEPSNQKEEDRLSVHAISPEKSPTKSNATMYSSSLPQNSQPVTRRRSQRLAGKLRTDDVIIIDDSDEEERAVPNTRERAGETDECDLARLALETLSLDNAKKRLKDLAPCPFLNPLSDEEEEEVSNLYRQKNEKEIKVIPSANIVLRGEDFKRLRGVRWLNDEVINAYMSLINVRNESIFTELTDDERKHIPRTYVFNTFFYTRLTSGPEQYDYAGVRKWTGRDKMDVMKQDLLLFPVNLGNHHWVLAGIDRERRTFLYLDSMGGSDRSGVLESLRKWYYDEVEDKYGEDIAKQEDLETWPSAHNRYMIRRVGVLPVELEPRECMPRLARIPAQTDGGSCGVFITKIADCLSLGIKIYFKQRSIPLIRRRMALDLLRGQLVM